MGDAFWGSRVAGVIVIALALPTSAVATPEPRWRAAGLHGGATCQLAASGGDLFAGAGSAGVFRSEDGGATWRPRRDTLPPDLLALDLEAARSSPGTLYVSSYEHGLWRTDDSGGHWRRLTNVATVSDVGVSPTDPDTAYMGADQYTFLKTTDGGASWTDLLDESENLDSDIVTVAPSNSQVVYAAGLQAWRSNDGGARWSAFGGPLTHIEAMAVHPSDPDTAYLGTYFDGLHRTVDGGATWQRISTGQLDDLPIASLAIDPSRPQRLYAGTVASGDVWVSENAGATWTRRRVPVAQAPNRNEVCALLVRANGTVFAGTRHGGLWRSTDRGAHWSRADRGLTGTRGHSLAVVPTRPRVAFAGTFGDGVFRTTDAGRTWQRRGLGGRVVTSLATTRSRPSLVLAGTEAGIFRSTDLGRTWRKVSKSLSVKDLAFAPSRPRVVFAADYRGVLRSRDFGRTWTDLKAQPTVGYLAVAVHPRDPSRVWVATRSSGVARSTNSGRTFRLNGCCLSPFWANDLVISPKRPFAIYAATDYGAVVKSVRGGRDGTWHLVTPPTLDDGYALVLDPRRPRTVYVGTIGARVVGGVYRSRDAGRTWSRMAEGMRTTWVTALAMTPGGRLYAGTAGYGMEAGGGVYVRQVR
ncbi:MAG TPA: hypothetical protein VFK52_02160 [Nocardioidaceae bacterium]|nr:hypothetical protein [Nocardioidaceae bacterium]